VRAVSRPKARVCVIDRGHVATVRGHGPTSPKILQASSYLLDTAREPRARLRSQRYRRRGNGSSRRAVGIEKGGAPCRCHGRNPDSARARKTGPLGRFRSASRMMTKRGRLWRVMAPVRARRRSEVVLTHPLQPESRRNNRRAASWLMAAVEWRVNSDT